MKIHRNLTYLCFIPFLCVLPMFGTLSCSGADAADLANDSIQTVQRNLAEFPENLKAAQPYIEEDANILWNKVAGSAEVYAESVGLEVPNHPLAEAEIAREKLISGASFDEVVKLAMKDITPEDLQNMPADDLRVLNGVLPFEIDLTDCGETMADVLNSLDIGQVSAVLRSEEGYHLIQLLDRDGGRVKIGHVVFEITPAAQSADEVQTESEQETETVESKPTEGMTPYEAALWKLNQALNGAYIVDTSAESTE